ncbi:trace amine-associated receptor 8a-like [Esox lucius]|uniref:trace amine-associated receptor 8a-like n=1 Tax=Esox lucius TaxID=8010 RepID=UPI001476EC3B|nr:trace amine-associated receptor 8a-like [Esox lucius]
MEEHEDNQYCFQDGNSSCRKTSISTSIYISLYIIFSLISAVTVFLNLLVIISISHFKQLHTPTKLLILSLAVSDLLVGLIVIPATTVAIMEPCWVLGEYFCALFLYITSLCDTSSLGNLILISIDRYVAVCDPLLYHLKITPRRTICCIFMSWCCCIIYDVVYVKLCVNIQVPSGCYEECNSIEGTLWFYVFDFLISVIVPCSIIITLYLKIFLVARSQSRKIQNVSKCNTTSAVTTTPAAATATTTPAVGPSGATTVTAPSRAGTAGKTSDLRAAFGSNATLEADIAKSFTCGKDKTSYILKWREREVAMHGLKRKALEDELEALIKKKSVLTEVSFRRMLMTMLRKLKAKQGHSWLK